MTDFQDYIQNENQVSIDDLYELKGYYEDLIRSHDKLGTNPPKQVSENLENIIGEIFRRGRTS